MRVETSSASPGKWSESVWFPQEVALTLPSCFVLPVCRELCSVGPGLFASSSLVLTPGIHLPGLLRSLRLPLARGRGGKPLSMELYVRTSPSPPPPRAAFLCPALIPFI